MVDSCRLLESAMGSTHKKVETNEMDTVVLQRRSIRACRDIAKGEVLTREMIEFQRPCPNNALKPNDFQNYQGIALKKAITKGSHLTTDDFI